MAETYFDFDAETMQITQKVSEPAGCSSPAPVFSPSGLTLSRSRERVNISEDTGFESSSDRSSLTLSQDGILNESPGSVSPRSNTYSQNFQWPLCATTSSDSVASKPIKRYDSKDSVNTSSSFWDSNFSAETKAVLSKVRDQMRASLKRVKELEKQAKQIPLLQVKISTLQQEKRQLSNQLKSKVEKNVRKSRSCSLTSNSSYQEETRSIGVGNYSVHDILCKQCKEFQSKLLGRGDVFIDLNQNETFERPACLKPSTQETISKHRDDTIHVFQDRCTQTRSKEQKDCSTQITRADCPTDNKITNDLRSVPQKTTTRTFQDRSCGSSVTTRSVGVGQIGSFVKDACVGENKEITTVNDFGVQKTVDVDDKMCGVQKTETTSTGINVSPTLISVGTGCSLADTIIVSNVSKRSLGSQTTTNSSSFVSVGVGMFSVDDFDEYDSCHSKKQPNVSVEEILESNRLILSSNNVAVSTHPWEEVKSKILHDHQASKQTTTVGLNVSIPTQTVGCGVQSVTDVECLKCAAKSSRSLGVHCKPDVSDAACGENTQETIVTAKPVTSVGVGECCVTDNYCERCFSTHTRTIGVGNGSTLADTCDSKSIPCETFLEKAFKDSDAAVQYNNISKITQNNEDTPNQDVGYLSGSERMFSDEYERITDGWVNSYENIKLKRLSNPSKEILLACELLQKHFQDAEHLDENKLLVCMKSIEDYWFDCVTESTLDVQFMSGLLELFKQNLPLLLEGLINSQDENGNTALHYLVTYGKFDCVNELLKTDLCDLNITNKAGYTAVMLGSLKDCKDEKDRTVLERLFERGNLNCIAQSTGQTALMLAAGTGRVDMVDLLLQCGAAKSINATDLDGSTALMCACEHGYSAIVKHLLAVHGCDATVQDHDGSTCFSIAMEQNRKDIALMIYSHLQLQDTKSTKMNNTWMFGNMEFSSPVGYTSRHGQQQQCIKLSLKPR